LIKKILIIAIAFSAINIFSENISKEWSVENNFDNSLYQIKNAELNYINNIPAYYSIKKNKYQINKDTDLYLSFDKGDEYDETKKYKFIYKNFQRSSNIAVLNQSGYFIGDNERIELIGTEQSVFKSGMVVGSFSVNFWLYPVSYSNNETILRIGSLFYDTDTDNVQNQSIVAKLVDGRITWDFNNIFSNDNIKKELMQLESYSRILPEKWSHISLVFDSYSGLIKEYINGSEEGILIATDDGTINSTVLNLQFHENNRCIIMLGSSFSGAIDEFYITKNTEPSDFFKYSDTQGEITSNLIDFGIGGIKLKEIIFDANENNNSKIIYLYRCSDNPFDEDFNNSQNIKWHLLENKNLLNQNLRYLQWKVIMLPGDNNNYSPDFKKIKLVYDKNEPPSKPQGLMVFYCNSTIDVKWKMNSELDLKGYKIYYGTKKGEYFGTDAAEGESPIDAGKTDSFTLTGLKNDKIYYIAITAYDDDFHKHEGVFSEEVNARPFGKCK